MPKGVYKRTAEMKTGKCSKNRRKLSEETKQKISKANSVLRGFHHSEETKRKIGLNGFHYGMKGKKQSIDARRKIGEANTGNKCVFWKGGIYPDNLKIRQGIEYKLWREAVFARDNWTCQKTGIKGEKLQTHHIQNFSNCPELRTSIENGITLSEKAHKEFHKKYGIKNNTCEQLNEFLNI